VTIIDEYNISLPTMIGNLVPLSKLNLVLYRLRLILAIYEILSFRGTDLSKLILSIKIYSINIMDSP